MVSGKELGLPFWVIVIETHGSAHIYGDRWSWLRRIDRLYMHINNLVLTSTIGEDVLWLFGFNFIIGKFLFVQSRRLEANISLPTYEKEISAMNTNFGA